MLMINEEDLRQRSLNQKPVRSGPVIYWMQRDQRVQDNWALLYAMRQAQHAKEACLVVFCLQPEFLGAASDSIHYRFMWQGLVEIARILQNNRMPWLMLSGDPAQQLSALAERCRASIVYTDFNPLRLGRVWRNQLAAKLKCRLIEVDAHNIIPCWQASDKLEYAARTIRPKIHRQLENWLHEFPLLPEESIPPDRTAINGGLANAACSNSAAQPSAEIMSAIQPLRDQTGFLLEQMQTRLEQWKPARQDSLPAGGGTAGIRTLQEFITRRLPLYTKRNDPNLPAVSGLSPYFHFGQISAQRAALAVREAVDRNPDLVEAAGAFLEELIIRRELAENYCFYMPDYDNWQGLPAWGRSTLEHHFHDLRPYLYEPEQLEHGLTHDPLWNAAQLAMLRTGTMPGYLRMYWAKKILEWTRDPKDAQLLAIQWNDRYLLDGRDPNGYTGIAWSIGGLHDRPWADRPIFGKIRFMSFMGCRRKFDVDAWISRNS